MFANIKASDPSGVKDGYAADPRKTSSYNMERVFLVFSRGSCF